MQSLLSFYHLIHSPPNYSNNRTFSSHKITAHCLVPDVQSKSQKTAFSLHLQYSPHDSTSVSVTKLIVHSCGALKQISIQGLCGYNFPLIVPKNSLFLLHRSRGHQSANEILSQYFFNLALKRHCTGAETSDIFL